MSETAKFNAEIPAHFPSTHWSVLSVAARGEADEAARAASLEFLAKVYWKPIYTYLRIRWRQSPERAMDLTQDFFVAILERSFLDRIEEGRGRFRNFVRACIDNFIRNRLRTEQRQLRGGGKRIFSLDVGEDPEEFCPAASSLPPEDVLDHCWKLSLLQHAVRRLRTSFEDEGRVKVFEVFQAYDLAESEAKRPTYKELAQQFGLGAADIDNYLSIARKRLYRILREIVAASVDRPESLREELGDFFPEQAAHPDGAA